MSTPKKRQARKSPKKPPDMLPFLWLAWAVGVICGLLAAEWWPSATQRSGGIILSQPSISIEMVPAPPPPPTHEERQRQVS